MTSDPERRHRQSLRLKHYDYSWAGAYFVTIVTQNRVCRFGTIQRETMELSPAGKMLKSVWADLPKRFPSIALDAYIVMPNHFHALVVFPAPLLNTLQHPSPAEQKVPTRGTATERPTLGTIIGAWKSLTTMDYIVGVKTQNWLPFVNHLWQRNYYEHIVRDEDDLARIRYYIETNPQQWAQDAENPQYVPESDL